MITVRGDDHCNTTNTVLMRCITRLMINGGEQNKNITRSSTVLLLLLLLLQRSLARGQKITTIMIVRGVCEKPVGPCLQFYMHQQCTVTSAALAVRRKQK